MRVPVLIFILFILQASSCVREGECPAVWYRKIDDRLTIINETSENITVQFSYDYPDDSLVLERYVPGEQVVNSNPGDNVGPNSREEMSIKGCWESTFERRIPSGKLHILIFNIDTIKAVPTSEIISRRLFTSYLFTLNDLKEMNWHVVYQ